MSVGIITGSSSGFGKEFAGKIKKYYPNIDELWLISRSKDKLENIKKELINDFNNIEVLSYDITTDEFINKYTELLINKKPQIEVLINNAGIGYNGKFTDLPLNEINKMIDLNIKSLTNITYLSIPYIIRKGHIIQIASAGGFVPQPGYAVYSSSKNFVYFLSKALAKELRKDGKYITIACPGPSDTSFYQTSSKYYEVPKYKYKNIVDHKKVVKKILKDSVKNKKVSIYGFKMKMVFILSKMFSYDFLMRFIK